MPPATTILQVLQANAARRGDAPALRGVADTPAMSHAELLDFVELTGRTLREAGLGRGDIVMIALPDGPEAIAALLAVGAICGAFPVPALEAAPVYERYFDELDIAAVLMGDRPDAALTTLAAARGATLLRAVTRAGAPAGAFDLAVDRPKPRRAEELAQPQDDAVIVATSGATGTPKFVASNHESLLAAVRRFAEWNELTDADRTLCVMPIAHLHSHVRSALPVLFEGGEVIWAPGFRARDAVDWIERLAPTVLTGAPAIFRALLEEANARNWRPSSLRFVGIGSDKVDPDLVDHMRTALGAHVAQFYGLSETAPFIALTPRHGEMPRGAAGKLNPDWEVSILGADGRPAPPGASGEIAVRGGYVNRLIGRSAAGRTRYDGEGRFLTGDLARIDNGFLFVEGRADDVINRGGEKISPQAVEAALEAHEAVARAIAFGLPDKRLGQRVAALVQRAAGQALDERVLRGFAAERLERFATPERIFFVDAMPTSAVGKISRREIAALYADSAEETANPSAPMAAKGLARDILHLLRKQLSRDDIAPEDDFFAVGGDSFGALELLLEIEQRYGVSLGPAVLVEHGSAAGLARYIETTNQKNRAVGAVVINAGAGGVPLVIAPGVGGGVGFAPQLAAALPADRRLLVLHTSKVIGDPAKRDLYALARHCLAPIDRDVAEGAVLAGHSLGAHLAWAMAQQMRDEGRPTPFVAVLDDEADLHKRKFGAAASPPADRNLVTCNQWALDSTPARPGPGRIVYFAATTELARRKSDPTGGWGEIALGGVDIAPVQGSHTSILEQPDIVHLAAALASAFAAAPAPAAAPFDEARRLRYEARLAARRGDLAGEIANYRKVVALDPAQPYWAYGNLSEALWQAGDQDGARAAYYAAIEHDPWPLTTDGRFIEWLNVVGYTAEVEAAVARARAVTADHPSVYEVLGEFFMVLSMLDEAEAVLREGVKADDRNVMGRLRLGRVLLQRGRVEESTHYMEDALACDPTSHWLCARIARHHLALNASERALATLQRFEAHTAPEYEVTIAHADALAALQRWPAAAERFRQAAEMRPASAVAHFGAAQALLQLGNRSDALTHARRAAEGAGATPAMQAFLRELSAT